VAAAWLATVGREQEVLENQMIAPFPYFGSKRAVASLVWELLGNVDCYVEPFAGSAAVLLARPAPRGLEVINDADGLIVNVWRAIRFCPEETARWADWPKSESDLHARHAWLISERESLRAKLEGDPMWCDPKAAGWWIWGACCWLGARWCSEGIGPWAVVDGELVDVGDEHGVVSRRRPHIGAQGITTMLTVDGSGARIAKVFRRLSERLRDVVIMVGDWERAVADKALGRYDDRLAGVFLDPPYSVRNRADAYGVEDREVAHRVRQWCIENADDRTRIVLAGMGEEHDELLDHGWTKHVWSSSGGMNKHESRAATTRHTETLWISPACLSQMSLFDVTAGSAQ
jgi:site-specific DNA-adenine methylase